MQIERLYKCFLYRQREHVTAKSWRTLWLYPQDNIP